MRDFAANADGRSRDVKTVPTSSKKLIGARQRRRIDVHIHITILSSQKYTRRAFESAMSHSRHSGENPHRIHNKSATGSPAIRCAATMGQPHNVQRVAALTA
jgi:hypothetical protein